MTPKKRLNKLIIKLNEIDSIGEYYNPVLVNVVGGQCWEKIALLQDMPIKDLLHQEIDSLEYSINEYDARLSKFTHYQGGGQK